MLFGTNLIILVCTGRIIFERCIILAGFMTFSSRCPSFRKTPAQQQRFSAAGLLSVPSVMIIASHNYNYCLYRKGILWKWINVIFRNLAQGWGGAHAAGVSLGCIMFSLLAAEVTQIKGKSLSRVLYDQGKWETLRNPQVGGRAAPAFPAQSAEGAIIYWIRY